ncbi:hypothetical protein diail_7955 [Diaporthe ilicicola]|nr:hypothetical protein diail_7955 [Diaporthe ilicicola]
MSPWESDTDVEASGSGSDDESTFSSGSGDVDAQSSKKMNSKTWKQEFFDRLGDIKTFGDFACMTRYSTHINPGLEVAGSLIPLPLVDRDASTIKSKCEKAPFGRGDNTVVDESVRRTWQLDASLFRCSNPAWPAFLDTVLREAVQKLGMPEGVRASPWKLLLYEEGSFFRPHKDSEKEPGMIGTLVISLPSEYDGAEVHISHSNRRHVFETSASSKFNLTALAWYSDVTHEVKPLTAGYRLVMTYNLVQQGGPAPSAGVLMNQQAQLKGLLVQSTSPLASKKKVIYRLDYKYSESSLSIQNLKGRDAQTSRCLKQACQETGLCLLLALMTRRESEEDEYYGCGENTLQLDYVANLEGNRIAKSVDAEMSEILGPNPYKDRDADSEDAGDFTGNEAAPSQYRYHDAVLLIVPKIVLFDLVKSPHCSAANLIQMVCFSTAASSDDLGYRHEAVSFLAILLENFRLSINEKRLLVMILRACKLCYSQALYKKAMRRAVMEARRGTRHHLTYLSLVAMARPKGSTAEMAEAVAELINEFFYRHADQDWNEYLGELVDGLDASSLNEALQVVETRLRTEELKQSFRSWRSSVESSKFETKDVLTASDLSLVLNLIRSHVNDDEWVSNRLLPRLSERAEKQLLYALLKVLCAEDGHLALKHTESLARRLLNATLPKLNLEIDDLEPKSPGPPQGSSYLISPSNDTDRTEDNVTGYLNLLENCFMCSLNDQGMQLLSNSHENLSEAISRLPPRDPRAARHNIMGLGPYGVPNVTNCVPAEDFLASLVVILHKYQLLDPPPFCKDLFLLLFTRYILPDQPQNPPQRPHGWSHKPRFCSRHDPRSSSRGNMHGNLCYECGIIQDFIRAPDRSVGRFTYAKKIRSHLEYMLPREHYRCETDMEKVPGSNCQTLVVTKIGRDTEFKEDMKKFGGEMQLYEQRLLPFRQPVVRRLLGNETYRSLILMEGTAAPAVSGTAPASSKRAASGSPEGQPASTRQRRTDDVIDLTGE